MVSSFAGLKGDELSARIEARLVEAARCPAARYVAACQCFDRGRPAPGVRHMMIAYHAEPRLQSAALLAFAGLNWVSRPRAALLPVLLETWEEFRRPDFDRSRTERVFLDAMAEPEPGVEGLGELARRLWRIPIRILRAQIREAVLRRDAALCPLLLAPA